MSFFEKTENRLSPAIVAVVLGPLFLAACQTDGTSSVSLSDAQEMATQFESESFTPPPRTVDDIVALVENTPLQDPDRIARLEAQMNEPLPETADAARLANAHLRRAEAANQLGRGSRALEEYRQADVFMNRADGSVKRMRIIRGLARAEMFAGDYGEAIRLMERQAAARPRRSSYAALVRVYAGIGNLAKAEEVYEKAQNQGRRGGARAPIRAHAGGDRIAIWDRVHDAEMRATILEAEGRYADARTYWLRSIEEFRRTGEEAKRREWIPSRRLSIARNLRKDGRLLLAEADIRDALKAALKTSGRESALVSRALRDLARTKLKQGRPDQAEKLLRVVEALNNEQGLSGDSKFVIETQGILGASLAIQSRWEEALAVYEDLRGRIETNEALFNRRVGRTATMTLTLVKAGRANSALAGARKSYRGKSEKLGPKHFATAKAGAALATALAAVGKRDRALALYKQSVPILLTRSRRSEDEDSEGQIHPLMKVMLEAYIDLLATFRDEGRDVGLDIPAETFRLAAAARLGGVSEAFVANAARAAVRDPGLAQMVRQEQDTLKQIGVAYATLAKAQTDTADNEELYLALRTRIDRLRGARAALREEIEARFPDYALLIDPRPVQLPDARAVLGAHEALLTFYVGETRSFVWALAKGKPVAFAPVGLGRAQLAGIVEELRGALDPDAANLGAIPAFNVALAHRLYRDLLAPVEAVWKDKKSLLVVTDGALGHLPLSVLPTRAVALSAEAAPLFSDYRDIAWLARDHSVTVLPSVNALLTLRSLPPGNPGRLAFAGFGDPWFSAEQQAAAESESGPTQVSAVDADSLVAVRGVSFRRRNAVATAGMQSADLSMLPRLPDTADEVRSIAMALDADPSKDVFIGAAANEGAVKSMTLSDRKVVAFATHGLVAGDLDGLEQPALALSAPAVAGGQDNGLLTMGEVLGLRLDADWVVLSACNTGSGEGAGAEAISGLGRAFFYAGARALLVTNWPVETTSARELTTDLFRRQASDTGLSRAEALRQSMMALVDGPGYQDPGTGKTVFAYAHPIFWAPFSLVGDGGGAAAGS